MKSDKQISYSSDIIRDATKELGISEDKVKHALEFTIFYIKKLTSIPEVFSIYIPELGQMYLNASYLKHQIGYLGEILKKKGVLSDNQKTNLQNAENRLKLLNEALSPGYSPHKKRLKFRNMYFTKGKTVKELEELQNKES